MFGWICENHKLFLLFGAITLVIVYLAILFGRTVTGWWRWQKQESDEEKWSKIKGKYK